MAETDWIMMFKNVMVALGLGPDEEYDDRYFDDDEVVDRSELDGEDVPERPVRDRAGPGRTVPAASRTVPPGDANTARSTTGTVGAVRPIRSVSSDDDASFTVRPIARTDEEVPAVTSLVSSKPRILAPQSFGDAKVLADEFKRSTPVIMQLSDVDRELARRLIDFASGVCYSLGGSMEKMATNVFMLLPRGTEVSADERRRIEERGFDRV